MKKCEIITTINQNGGVEKNVSTINLGVALANQGIVILHKE